jgi:hypothetical protein
MYTVHNKQTMQNIKNTTEPFQLYTDTSTVPIMNDMNHVSSRATPLRVVWFVLFIYRSI